MQRTLDRVFHNTVCSTFGDFTVSCTQSSQNGLSPNRLIICEFPFLSLQQMSLRTFGATRRCGVVYGHPSHIFGRQPPHVRGGTEADFRIALNMDRRPSPNTNPDAIEVSNCNLFVPVMIM